MTDGDRPFDPIPRPRRRGVVIPFRRRPAPGDADDQSLVEVHRCDQAEAVVVKSLLDSEGIPVLLRSSVAHSVHPFTVGAQGEDVVLVPKTVEARSRRLLARLGPRRSILG